MTSSSRAARLLLSAIFLVMAFGVLALGAIGIGPQTNLVGTTSANQATEPVAAAAPSGDPPGGGARPSSSDPRPSSSDAAAGASAAPTAVGAGASAASAAVGAASQTSEPAADLTPHLAVTLPRPAAPDELTGYQWPLIHGRLTLPYGATPWGSRIVDGERFHDGVDLATFCGDRVVAAHAGVIIAASRHFDQGIGWIGDLGPYFRRLDAKKLWDTLPIVIITDDGNGYRSVYAHFEKVVVKPGQTIRAGQLIGYEGRTGHASGCHVHYGLFSPIESAAFAIDPAVVKRMKVPATEIARIDPLLVLPYRADLHAPATAPTPAVAPE
jgi:murein DD-endopeptidase MepM/ murein hydrolase activator NlpD